LPILNVLEVIFLVLLKHIKVISYFVWIVHLILCDNGDAYVGDTTSRVCGVMFCISCQTMGQSCVPIVDCVFTTSSSLSSSVAEPCWFDRVVRICAGPWTCIGCWLIGVEGAWFKVVEIVVGASFGWRKYIPIAFERMSSSYTAYNFIRRGWGFWLYPYYFQV
jgi:hypothetical protein